VFLLWAVLKKLSPSHGSGNCVPAPYLGCFRFLLRNIAVLVEVSFTFPFSIQANHRVVCEIAV